jgi:hypothetical protein
MFEMWLRTVFGLSARRAAASALGGSLAGGLALSIREHPYIEAARARGAGSRFTR